jgi:hypothetical protein
LTKRAKASLQQRQAATAAPAKPKRVSSSANGIAHPTEWNGNQFRLRKIAISPLDLLHDKYEPVDLTVRKDDPDHHNRDTKKNKKTIRRFGSKANTFLAMAMQENNSVSSEYPFGDVYPKMAGPNWATRQDVRDVMSGPHTPSQLRFETNPFQPDELPGGQKTGDAANFGLYKMNWLMIRQTEWGKMLIELETERQTQKIRENKQNFAPTAWNVEAAVGDKINKSTDIASVILQQAMEMWHAEIPPEPDHPTKGNFWAGHRAGWTGLNNPGAADWDDIVFYYNAVMAIKAKLDSDKTGKFTTGNSRLGVKVPNR